MPKLELLAPAGNLEKLKTAVLFGADAVYFGLPDFSLRARINQFDQKSLKEGVDFARKHNKKVYLTFNIYAHQKHLKKLSQALNLIEKLKPDALIISDPGVLSIIKEKLPGISIHLSTQANVTNAQAAKFWFEQGVERVILARELPLEEIKAIKKAVPKLELEVFVHGAMCMAYSGRCLLSSWMAGRSANLGDCAQPCRWKYHLEKEKSAKTAKAVDDKNRFEMVIQEDSGGTYLFNSFDICLIEYLKELQEAGVDSFKIEGRGKSSYYVALAVKAYREVIDLLSNKKVSTKQKKQKIAEYLKDLQEMSGRGFWTGFLLGAEPPQMTGQAAVGSQWEFVGIALENENSQIREVFIHNALFQGDKVEAITPDKKIKTKIKAIYNEKGEQINSAHGGRELNFRLHFDQNIPGSMVLRKKLC